MSQKKNKVTIFEIKKGEKAVTVKPVKGLKMFLDGKEVVYETSEYQGKVGQFLYLNKVDDEINRINELAEEGKLKADTAQKILDGLERKKEWGISSFVKAEIKD